MHVGYESMFVDGGVWGEALVILDDDPLVNIRNTNTVNMVMKNGFLYDGDTMNQVWPKKEKLSPLWWWNDGPNN